MRISCPEDPRLGGRQSVATDEFASRGASAIRTSYVAADDIGRSSVSAVRGSCADEGRPSVAVRFSCTDNDSSDESNRASMHLSYVPSRTSVGAARSSVGAPPSGRPSVGASGRPSVGAPMGGRQSVGAPIVASRQSVGTPPTGASRQSTGGRASVGRPRCVSILHGFNNHDHSPWLQ